MNESPLIVISKRSYQVNWFFFLIELQSRSIAKKIRESEDFDDPSDFDSAKFKTMGKFAAGFSGRDIQDMTAVNFLDVLNDGALLQIEFPKDSVSDTVNLQIYEVTPKHVTF